MPGDLFPVKNATFGHLLVNKMKNFTKPQVGDIWEWHGVGTRTVLVTDKPYIDKSIGSGFVVPAIDLKTGRNIPMYWCFENSDQWTLLA